MFEDKSQWVNLEINGQPVQAPPGSTVMEAAVLAKIKIPHFCYHKKLSLAASCRMCLVQVEKMPKLVPACVTRVSEGMCVWTRSEKTKAAQEAVMQFLLANHPLDCPVCDKGGECMLQDASFGYGNGISPFSEVKRAVAPKRISPLISTQEMTRCIQCTRCIRFADEIGGLQELGMVNRGDRSEVVTFDDEPFSSELSGNVIDLCPVGALTSRPARFKARAWELQPRATVSPHDALNANVFSLVRGGEVIRMLGGHNEAVNECWLSDKDRFSYEACESGERLLKPLVKQQNGSMLEVDWDAALPMAAARLRDILRADGPEAVGGLISPFSTTEELGLFKRLMNSLGIDNIDSRLMQTDFSDDAVKNGAPWLGMPVAGVNQLKTMLFIGSFLREDQPLLCVRVRDAAKKGAKVFNLNSVAADWRLPVAGEIVVAPSKLVAALSELVAAAHRANREVNVGIPEEIESLAPGAKAVEIVEALMANKGKAAIFLGSFAQHYEHAASIVALTQLLSALTGATFGILPDAGNRVSAAALNVRPEKRGLDAQAMLAKPLSAYVLFNVDSADCAYGTATKRALEGAKFVLSFASFMPQAGDPLPDILLPVAPYTETSGSYINMEGRIQSFSALVPAKGKSRPGWQALVAFSKMLDQRFPEDTPETVRARFVPDAESLKARLDNHTRYLPSFASPELDDFLYLERVGSQPIYETDPVARRAKTLHQTPLAERDTVAMNPSTANRWQLKDGDRIRAKSSVDDLAITGILSVVVDDSLPDGVARIDAQTASTMMLPGQAGAVALQTPNGEPTVAQGATAKGVQS